MRVSAITLKRIADRKLRGRGLAARLRKSVVMACEERKYLLPLGDFFTVVDYDHEIRMFNPDESVMTIMNNKIQKGQDSFQMYKNHIDTEKKDQEYEKEQASLEFEDRLRHTQKIQVTVK
jgi:hypothetical protein